MPQKGKNAPPAKSKQPSTAKRAVRPATAKKAPAKKKATKRAVGRPPIDRGPVCAALCAGLSEGRSLNELCGKGGIPSKQTILRWLADSEEFRAQYARAKEFGAEAIAEDILEIADDGRNDWMEKLDKEGQGAGWILNGEAVRRSQLRVDARKWLLAKLAPKKYGDKVQLGGAEDLPPIATSGELTMTPGDAYMRMLGATKK